MRTHYLSLSSDFKSTKLYEAINTSSGVGDAGKIIRTNASGLIDSSFFSPTLYDSVYLRIDGTNSMTGTLVLNSTGTFSAPSLSFTGDSDTGIYRVAANVVGIASGGTLSTTFTNTGFTTGVATASIFDLSSDGTAASPGIRRGSTGLFFPTSTRIGYSVSGTEVATVTSTGLGIGTSAPGSGLEVSGTTDSSNRITHRRGSAVFNYLVNSSNNLRLSGESSLAAIEWKPSSYYLGSIHIGRTSTATPESRVLAEERYPVYSDVQSPCCLEVRGTFNDDDSHNNSSTVNCLKVSHTESYLRTVPGFTTPTATANGVLSEIICSGTSSAAIVLTKHIAAGRFLAQDNTTTTGGSLAKSTYGVHSTATRNSNGTSWGVFASATASSGTNYGIQASGTGNSSLNYGGHFTASGTSTSSNIALWASASGSSGQNYALYVSSGRTFLNTNNELNFRSTSIFVRSPGTNILEFGTNSLTRMTIRADGNVGINDTNPATALCVDGQIKLSGSVCGLIIEDRATPSSRYEWYSTSNKLRLYRIDPSGATIFSIDSNGNTTFGHNSSTTYKVSIGQANTGITDDLIGGLSFYANGSLNMQFSNSGLIAFGGSTAASQRVRINSGVTSYGLFVTSGSSVASARLDISNSERAPILLAQTNSTGPLIQFQGTVGTGTNNINTSNSGAVSGNVSGPNQAGWTHYAMVKVRIGSSYYWIPIYS